MGKAITDRIAKMEELKDRTMILETEGVTRKSYIQLLMYHISLLKEVEKLVEAFDKDDCDAVTSWYEKRKI